MRGKQHHFVSTHEPNRIRTAALAGTIAVATGVSGAVTVPAMAQDGWNEQDASQILTGGENITEEQLQERTNAVAKGINSLNTEDLLRVNDPSEAAIGAEFQRQSGILKGLLEQSDANISDARASLAYALQVDADYEAARKALADYTAAANTVDVTVTGANEDGSDETYTITKADFEAVKAEAKAIAPQVKALNKILDDAIEAIQEAGVEDEAQIAELESFKLPEIAEDGSNVVEIATLLSALIDRAALAEDATEDSSVVYRNWVKAAAPLEGKLGTIVPLLEQLEKNREAKIAELQADVRAKGIIAQQSDAPVRSYYLQRAIAQRDFLRWLDAQFVMYARLAELYKSDQNKVVTVDGKTTTLRAFYAEKLNEIQLLGLNPFNDEALENVFNEDDNKALAIEVAQDYDALAAETAALNNFMENFQWQETVALAQAIDAQANFVDPTEPEPIDEPIVDPQPQPDAPEQDGSATGSSTTLKIAGIIAAILGVIGLIAGAFPLAAHLGIKF